MFDREPLLIGISVNTLENALRVVDIGPNAENKNEVFDFDSVFCIPLMLSMHVVMEYVWH